MDIIKGAACIAVVLIHYNWSNDIGLFIKTICRFAVPYFFFVSGYYVFDRNGQITKQATRRKIIHIVELLCKGGVFYFVFCIVWNYAYVRDWNLADYAATKVTFANIIKFAVNNDPFVYDHFWYMLALIYCYLTVYLLRNRLKDTYVLLLSIMLMLGFSVLEEFRSVFPFKNAYRLDENGTLLILSNTFLFRAMPFFLFGMFIRKRKPSISGNAGLALLCGTFIIGCLIALFEAVTVGALQFYLGTYVCVIALILITVCYSDLQSETMSVIGNKLSMNVYLYHIAVGKVFDLIAQKFALWNEPVFILFRPLCILAATLLIAWLLFKMSVKQKTIIITG